LHITKACIKAKHINDFIGGIFLSFCEKYFAKECSIKSSTFKIKYCLQKAKKKQKLPQLPIV
jgi:hypothetical protein